MHRSKAKEPSQPRLYTTEVQHDIKLPATLLCLTKLLLCVVVMQYDVMHMICLNGFEQEVIQHNSRHADDSANFGCRAQGPVCSHDFHISNYITHCSRINFYYPFVD